MMEGFDRRVYVVAVVTAFVVYMGVSFWFEGRVDAVEAVSFVVGFGVAWFLFRVMWMRGAA